MKALYYEKFGEQPHIRNLPDPTPTPDAVVLKVGASGVCRSDWHAWMGHEPQLPLPIIPGHEFAGTIVAKGANVRHWNVGDRVTAPFSLGCGHCSECNGGHHHVCDQPRQPGFTEPGSFAEYLAVDYADTNLAALPEDMDFATAASLGCRFITAFRAVADRGRVGPGEWVAVHGCGGIGLSSIMIASALGAQVLAVDIDEDKLALAKSLGANAVVNAKTVKDIPQAIRDLTGGGAHASIEALGHHQTVQNSLMSLRKRGRHVQVGLVAGKSRNPPVPLYEATCLELEILGSLGMPAHRYPAVFAMIQSGKLKPELLVGKTIRLDQAANALMELDKVTQPGVTVINSFD